MKCVVVNLSTLKSRGTWVASHYCGSTDEQEQNIKRSVKAAREAKTRIKKALKERDEIRKRFAEDVAAGRIRVIKR